jgi:autotransporter-associated beta strand protein
MTVSGVISDCGVGTQCAAGILGKPSTGGSIVKVGTGTLTLTGTNTYSGGTTINGGTLQIGNGGTSGSIIGNVTDNGTFAVDRSDTYTFAGAISGTGAFQQNGTGTTILTGANAYSGATTVSAGTLQAGAANAFSSSSAFTVAAGATLDIGEFSPTIGSLAGAGTVQDGDFTTHTLTVGADNTSTIFSGTLINGANVLALTKIGTGTFTITGTSTYSGGTTINGGLINFNTANNFGSGTITLDGGGLQWATGTGTDISPKLAPLGAGGGTFDTNGNNVTFASAIAGAGSLTKDGAGTLILDGNSTYSGGTTINGGTLEVDGSIADSSSVAVNSGGTLSGTGIVDPVLVATTIMSGGTLAPGNAANPTGTLMITGNLAFQSAALYLITVSGANASSASVTGTASLGGTVQAAFASPPTTKSYDILHSAGLGGTAFSVLTNTNMPAGFTDSLSYNTDDVFLNLNAALGAGTSLNQNQQAVANAINAFFNSGGTLPSTFGSLFNLTGANLANALSQIDGEDATGAQMGAFQLMSEFLDLIGEQGFGDGAANAGQVFDYAPLATKAPPSAPPFAQRWHAWGSGFGGGSFADGNATAGSSNLTTTTYGYAGGLDYRPDPDTLYGFALAGGGLNWGLANALGTGRSDAFQAGVYGRHFVGSAYTEGALAFANNWFATSRTVLGEQLQASFTGQSYAMRIEGGDRYGLGPHGAVGITPYAALQTQWFHTPAYNESGGALALAYNSKTANDTRTELGARFDHLTSVNATPLMLRARLAWAHDFVGTPALSAAFQSLPGSTFTVNGAPIPRDAALTSASAQWWLKRDLSFTAKFDGEFASVAQTYAGTGTLRYQW